MLHIVAYIHFGVEGREDPIILEVKYSTWEDQRKKGRRYRIRGEFDVMGRSYRREVKQWTKRVLVIGKARMEHIAKKGKWKVKRSCHSSRTMESASGIHGFI